MSQKSPTRSKKLTLPPLKLPITVADVKNRISDVREYYKDKRLKNAAFIDVVILNGSFMCDSPGQLFDSLTVSERLNILPEQGYTLKPPPLAVTRADGTNIGVIPRYPSIIPYMLMQRGVSVWCYLEAKEFNGGLIELAVSLYCEKY